ncbi:hypothetical protein LCGC14_1079140 [marine sediment metagenome]|uniref:Uncharacterized protein n=1 Tax=marine sediment metagenome TaxID=412755 RepID=A0A0F9QLK7_9ZZZZ
MTKQEKIREGITERIKLHYGSIQHINNTVLEDLVADFILERLHSQGVVIKVKRRLPDHGVLQTGNYRAGQHSMLEAGYVAVEPLIEVTG